MSRDALLAAASLAISVVCWVVYGSSHGAAWATAMLIAMAACAVFAVRAARAPVAIELSSVAPPAAVRTAPPKPANDHRLALHGVRIDPREIHPRDALRRAIAVASIEHGAAHLESGNTEEALAAFESVLADLGEDPAYARTRAAAHALRAMAYERRRDAALARVEYLRALELDPEQRQAREALARLG